MRIFLGPTILILLVCASIQAQEGMENTQKQVLLYGIKTDILQVLGDLTHDKDSTYNEMLADVLTESRDSDIAQGIYRVWEATEYTQGLELARDAISQTLNGIEFSASATQAAIVYLAALKDTESVSILVEIINDPDLVIAASAVRALGKIGDDGVGSMLLERLQDADSVAAEDLVAALIVALGEIKYVPAADTLLAIVDDAAASLGHRRLCCIALGQMDRDSDYSIIERIYSESDDAMLRAYALAGLAEFSNKDSTDILIRALKRDSFWRIRVTAAEKIAAANIDTPTVQELLRYKAAHDPVSHVRIAAIDALGSIANSVSGDFLLEYFADEHRSIETRLTALNALVASSHPGTVKAIGAIFDKFWEKDSERFLEFTAKELSRIEGKELLPIYARMLQHPNWLIVVYGIRGIRHNALTELYPTIDALDVEGTDKRIRRETSR